MGRLETRHGAFPYRAVSVWPPKSSPKDPRPPHWLYAARPQPAASSSARPSSKLFTLTVLLLSRSIRQDLCAQRPLQPPSPPGFPRTQLLSRCIYRFPVSLLKSHRQGASAEGQVHISSRYIHPQVLRIVWKGSQVPNRLLERYVWAVLDRNDHDKGLRLIRVAYIRSRHPI